MTKFAVLVLALTSASAIGVFYPASAQSTSGDPSPLCKRPVRVAVLPDKSGSTGPNFVPQLKPDQLLGLKPLILRCGGELGLEVVGYLSGTPVERWFVPAPETPPAFVSAGKTSINAAIERSQHERLRREHAAREKTRVERAETDFVAFFQRASALLARPATDGQTPLWTAIKRADAFLGEPETGARRSARYLVIVSDGINTVGDPVAITSGAEVFFCYGGKSAGSLTGIMMTTFESPSSAFRHIIEMEGADAH